MTAEEMGLPDAGNSPGAAVSSEIVEAPVEQDAFTRFVKAMEKGDTETAEPAGVELDAGVDECRAKIAELRGSKLASPVNKVSRYKFTSRTSDGDDVVLRVTDVPTDRPTSKGTTVISIDRVNPGVDSEGRRKGLNVGVIEVEEIPGFKRSASYMDYGGSTSRYDIYQLPTDRRNWSEHRPRSEDPIPNPVAKTKEFLDMLERGTLTHTMETGGKWVDVPPNGPAPEGSEQV